MPALLHIFITLISCGIALFASVVLDLKINLFVFSINSIQKKNGMKWLIKYLRLWKKMEFCENFSHEV